eukprot:6208993-Pleurochrysis_carterae.AAC.1
MVDRSGSFAFAALAFSCALFPTQLPHPFVILRTSPTELHERLRASAAHIALQHQACACARAWGGADEQPAGCMGARGGSFKEPRWICGSVLVLWQMLPSVCVLGRLPLSFRRVKASRDRSGHRLNTTACFCAQARKQVEIEAEKMRSAPVLL